MCFTLRSHRYAGGCIYADVANSAVRASAPAMRIIALLALLRPRRACRVDPPLRMRAGALSNLLAERLAITMYANSRQPSWWHLPAPFLNFHPLH